MVDTKKKKVNNKEVKKELFMNFNVNAGLLPEKKQVSIKVDDPRLKDTKYFSSVINGLMEDTGKLEKLKNSDKIIKLSQQFSKRLSLLQDVLKLNNPEELRNRGKKELRGHIKSIKNDSLGVEQFGVSSVASFDSLLARVSIIGTCLYEKSDVFTVKKDSDGNLRAFTRHSLLYPELPVQQDGKTVWVNNPNNKEFAMAGDKVERFYKQEILGKKPKSKINASDDAISNTTGSPSATNGDTNGATAKTVNSIFSEMNNTFNWFKTKDPKQIVKNILEADFGNSGSDVSDPANFLLDAKDFAELITKLIEVVKLLNKEHPKTNPRIDDVLKVVSGVYFDRQEKTWKLTN